jgi:hypothetical protein
VKIIKDYTKALRTELELMGYRVEYNMMYKLIDSQGIKIVLDFASHTVGITRVEMPKTFYLEIDRWHEAVESIDLEIRKLKLEGIVEL